MKSDTYLKLWVGLFVLAFFAYLFGPLILMSVTAYNMNTMVQPELIPVVQCH